MLECQEIVIEADPSALVEPGVWPVAPVAMYSGAREVLEEQVAARVEATQRLMLFYSGASWNTGGGGQRPRQLAHGFAAVAATVHMHATDECQIAAAPVAVANVEEWTTWPAAEWTCLYIGCPDELGAQLAEEAPADWVVWYDCVDDWRQPEFGDWFRPEREALITARADVVTSTARYLHAHMRRLVGRSEKPCGLVYNSTMLLEQLAGFEDPEPDVDCVFVGHLGYDWWDKDLIRLLASHCSVRMIGARNGTAPAHRNIEWAGEVPNARLLPELARARVGIVPFRDLPLTRSVFPVKYADYLAAGIPTVAACTPELHGMPYAEVTWSPYLFLEEVQRYLRRPPSRGAVREAAAEFGVRAAVSKVVNLFVEGELW